MADSDIEIEEWPIGKEEQNEQEALTSIADAALKKVESDRLSISSFVPLSPVHCISAPGSSRPNSLSHGASIITNSSQSITSNGFGTLNMGLSLADSIESCVNEEIEEKLHNLPETLESALTINQILQRRITIQLHKLQETLKENKLRQSEILLTREETTLTSQIPDIKHGSQYFLRISSFCIPYFKDKSGRQPPRNKDARFKLERNYMDLYTTKKRKWLTRELNRLVSVTQKKWYDQLIKEWVLEKKEAECKLRNLKSIQDGNTTKVKISNESREELAGRIVRCTTQLECLNSINPEDIQISKNAPIDWLHVAAEAFDGHRTPEECQLVWENLCRPTLDQGAWTEEEDIKIQKMVQVAENGKPNWDAISLSLPTKRSAFQVFQRWVSFIYPTLYPMKWTPTSTSKLIETVNLLKCGSVISWSQVQQHMAGFTKVQLQSRWRNIDPSNTKGSFTIEDDITLIKGLYKFNLNFQKIVHFFPGRSPDAVKRRFRRALLPGLCILPWTVQEDDQIINYCSENMNRWRDLACTIKGRSPASVRMRYHVIQMWQSLSGTVEQPPPLFPVSMTTDEEEIDMLRREMIKERPALAKFIDIKPNTVRNFCLKQMEARRHKLKEKQEKFVKDNLEKVTSKRGRKIGETYMKKTNWPDYELTEFFIPGRNMTSMQTCTLNANKHPDIMQLLSSLLQLKIVDIISKAELKFLTNLGIDENDIDVANLLRLHHNHELDEKPEYICPACRQYNSEHLCLIPPNHMTVTSYASIHHHQRKLYQMSQKSFLPYRFSENDLIKLGDCPTIKKFKTESNVVDAENERSTSFTTNMPSKIHITQGKSAVVKDREYIPKANRKWNTYTRPETTLTNIIPIEVEEEPTKKYKCINNTSTVIIDDDDTSTNVPAQECDDDEQERRSDKLLFERFKAIFFWPAVASYCRPTKKQENLIIEEINQNLNRKGTKFQRNQPSKKPAKFSGKLPELDIAEQLSVLKVYEEECKIKIAKRKNIDPNQEPEKKKNRVVKEHKYTLDNLEESKNIIDQEQVNKIIKESNTGALACPTKKNVLSLKRSLVMKKAWEERRKGTIKNRTSKRDKLQYIPRGSRTRNKVRTDIPIPEVTDDSTTVVPDLGTVDNAEN